MNCKIIRDLLPLYHDEVVSDESRELVEEHLKTCAECGAMLEDIHEKISAKNVHGIEQPMANGFKALKKRLRRKTVIRIAISVICAIAVVSSLYYGVFSYEMPIPYHEAAQTFTQSASSPLDFITKHKSINLFINGDALYISYSDTVWTRYIAKPDIATSICLHNTVSSDFLYFLEPPDFPESSDSEDLSEPPEPLNPTGYLDPLTLMISGVTKVYYLKGNYDDYNTFAGNDVAFAETAQNAVLIWEK